MDITQLWYKKMLNTHDGCVEKTQNPLEEQFKKSADMLLCIPGLPAQLKRDLRDLLQNSTLAHASAKKDTPTKMGILLQLYERALKFMSFSSSGLSGNVDKINELSNELNHLITELDFEGEVGNSLLDIRNKLMRYPNAHTLFELTLDAVILILDGSRNERNGSHIFLSQLNNDLSLILRDNSYSIRNTQDITTQSKALNVQFQSSIEALESELKNTHSLATLQRNIADIALHLTSLAQQSMALNDQEQALINKRRHNEQKLDLLYHKTTDHRDKIGDQAHRSRLDPLTKVHNRAAFDDRLEDEYREWLRNQTPFCLAIIDIDHFKTINESYGHLAGDKVLKAVARTLALSLRENDFLARFGGEEFVILLPDANDQTRTQILENVCENIENLPFKFKDKPLTVTVSIGASVFSDADNPLNVLDRADRALYRAKNNGRNQLAWESLFHSSTGI